MQSATHAKKILIIDGYNVIHQVPALRELLGSGLERARATLLAQCRAWRLRHGGIKEFIVVFDGDPSVLAPAGTQPGVKVVFSRDRHGADGLIRDLVRDAGHPADCTVVTDDREILSAVRRQGAESMPPAGFFSIPQRGIRGVAAAAAGNAKNSLKSSETASITREMSRIWGIEQ